MEQIASESRRLCAGSRQANWLRQGWRFAWMACVLAAISIATSRPVRAAEEYQVKAAFLLNFTKFVGWPEGAFEDEHSPLGICILGDDPFGSTLNEMVKGETINGHAVEIRRIRRAPASKECRVLYIARSEKEAARVLAETGPGILTVGEGEMFLRYGGIIAFVVEDRRVRFDIDQRAAAKAMLTLSSQLMMVARSVQQ